MKEPYIVQQGNEDALYEKLQKKTLEDIQRLSGNVWTDYNPHDPGITLAETANYALTELEYKLSFPSVDYLTESDRPFAPERFGLFSYADVFDTSTVTADDYRCLFLANLPEIANLQVSCDEQTNGYSFSFVKMPFSGDDESIIRKIERLYNENRNLCEWLEKVEGARTETLYLHSEIEIESGEDASDVLAHVYWCILHYFSDDADIEQAGCTKTEYELYKRLCRITGIRAFRTCYLMKDNVPQSRFPYNSTLFIPVRDEDVEDVAIFCGKTRLRIDVDMFRERLKALCLSNRGRSVGGGNGVREKKGEWRDIFEHYPVGCDMPECYHLSPGRNPSSSSFELYTRLYDYVITNGLEEVRMLPRLLSIAEGDEDFPHTQRTIGIKARYLDFLDSLYGVESQPAWLQEDNSYGETPEGTIRRRMNFLRKISVLQKERARARNILLPFDEGTGPMIKEWFCLLMGIETDDGHTVSNVLPRNNLRLIEYQEAQADIMQRVDSLLINEKMMKARNVRDVPYVELSRDAGSKKEEYEDMRSVLPFFNENLITGDLFRNGTDLKNYKIVKSLDDEYMLMYRHSEFGGWTNLGHDTDVSRLERLANVLRRYLRELNHESETVYVVEPVLADPSRPYELIVVFPAWTYRFRKPRYREECCRLLRSIIPAHLGGNIYWISEDRMRRFEFCYHQFLRTFTDNEMTESRMDFLKAMEEQLTGAEEIDGLDDTD